MSTMAPADAATYASNVMRAVNMLNDNYVKPINRGDLVA